MDKEVYEKKIAYLEERLSDVTFINEQLSEKRHAELAVEAHREEQFFKHLLSFCNQLYSKVGEIQTGLLDTMSKLQGKLSKASIRRTQETIKSLMIEHETEQDETEEK